MSDIESVRGVCGFRRALVTGADSEVANVSHLEIDNSRNHYHKRMTEFYYVLKGQGEIVLDGERRPIQGGRTRAHPAWCVAHLRRRYGGADRRRAAA